LAEHFRDRIYGPLNTERVGSLNPVRAPEGSLRNHAEAV
jgi:hypothetical protein